MTQANRPSLAAELMFYQQHVVFAGDWGLQQSAVAQVVQEALGFISEVDQTLAHCISQTSVLPFGAVFIQIGPNLFACPAEKRNEFRDLLIKYSPQDLHIPEIPLEFGLYHYSKNNGNPKWGFTWGLCMERRAILLASRLLDHFPWVCHILAHEGDHLANQFNPQGITDAVRKQGELQATGTELKLSDLLLKAIAENRLDKKHIADVQFARTRAEKHHAEWTSLET